jgi:hypothetical protein
MSNQHQQLSDDTDSSYSGTTFRSNKSDAVDLAFSDYESEDLLSETSADRAFVVSDNDALSYDSDKYSIEGEVSCGLGEGILRDFEDVSCFINKTKSCL